MAGGPAHEPRGSPPGRGRPHPGQGASVLTSLRWRFALALLRALPQGLSSRAFGHLADLPLPRWSRRAVLGGFSRLTGADPAEAELSLDAYGSLSEFFVRRLRPGARSWPDESEALASPVDGIVGAAGRLDDLEAVQAKGKGYSIAALLDDETEAERFRGGTFLTLYLSPRHYHRVHAPAGGGVRKARRIPGRLLPVNGAAVETVPELFPRNERLVCYLEGTTRLAVVAVGAFNVGRISSAFDPGWNRGRGPAPSVTNRGPGRRPETRRYEAPIQVSCGDELMAFHLGSTVILLFEPGRFAPVPELRPGREVLLGQRLGRLVTVPGTGCSPEAGSGMR